MVQHKLYQLQENANILNEIDGREQMEDKLGIKLKLHYEKNIDLMYDILNERKFDKSPPKISTKQLKYEHDMTIEHNIKFIKDINKDS